MSLRVPAAELSFYGVVDTVVAVSAAAWSAGASCCPSLMGGAPAVARCDRIVRARSVVVGMIKRRTTTMFFVEETQHGWSVRAGTERLGLFTNQRQALQDVRRRRAELQREGEHSTLVVGKGTDPDGNRPPRTHGPRR